MSSLPRKVLPFHRIDTERISTLSSNEPTSNIRFHRIIGSNSQGRNRDSDSFVHNIESFPGLTLTDDTAPEQEADRTRAAVRAHALVPSTHPWASYDTLDIDVIYSATPQAKKVKLKQKR